MNRKKLLFSALSIALVSVIGVTGILLTNSKYATTEEGTAKTNVAKWVFDVSAGDSYSDDDNLQSINLAETCKANTLIDGNIAPGTEGSFDIVMDTKGAEVGIDYTISFTNIPTNFPKNLVFTVDGNEYDLATGFSGNIPANASATDKVITKTVNWKWLYEAEDASKVDSADEDDTEDGKAAAKDLTFDITVEGVQVRPVHENV